MNELPELPSLSEIEKDELIRTLWAQVVELRKQVKELEGRLAKNSRSSSKPAPKSLRQGGQRPTGGQKGHPGSTLKKVAQPDLTVRHEAPSQCDACGRALDEQAAVETRQVFELPPLRQVTEHQVLQVQCACGKVHRGEFPEDVSAPVQYGPRALAAMVHMSQHHMLPPPRTAELRGDFFGLTVSDATVLSAVQQAAQRLQTTAQAIGQALIKQVLIERLYGVEFSLTQVWRILGALGFSPQKPERRAIERDEQAVLVWKRKTWPALKNSPARGAADSLHR